MIEAKIVNLSLCHTLKAHAEQQKETENDLNNVQYSFLYQPNYLWVVNI